MGIVYDFTRDGVVQRYTSHEGIEHDSLEGLGYDWERVSDPAIAPRWPLKVYMPRSTQDVVLAIQETRALGQKLTVRSRGHSSNDLVLSEGGAVLSTALMNRVIEIDEAGLRGTVQAGVVSADLDDLLAARGLGLPVIGDHNDITVGGFASVGGIGPASHRLGMFIDNVLSLELVDWEGRVVTAGRSENRALFEKVLAGTGRYGVITQMTVTLLKIDKYRTIVRNVSSKYGNFESFLAGSHAKLADPGDSLLLRAFYMELPGLLWGRTRVGRFYAYRETSQNGWKRLQNTISYGYLHALGEWAGRLPVWMDKIVKGLGFLGILTLPAYASIKNVEFFTDRIVSSTTGDPTRWLILLCPVEAYPAMTRKLYECVSGLRDKEGCFTFISFYVKGIRSAYLSPKDPPGRYVELTLYLGLDLKKMTPAILSDLVARVDDWCIELGSFRYMHTRTVKDPQKRAKVDPNEARNARGPG